MLTVSAEGQRYRAALAYQKTDVDAWPAFAFFDNQATPWEGYDKQNDSSLLGYKAGMPDLKTEMQQLNSLEYLAQNEPQV